MNTLGGEEKVGRLVRRSLVDPSPKLCPKCLKLVSQLSGWLTPTYYYCEACGYLGAVTFEVVEDE